MSPPAIKLMRFWQAIESIPGQEATLPEWRSYLGGEFDLAKRLLRPNGNVAEVIPSDGFGASGPLLQVVRHAEDDIVGVSEEGDRIELTKDQIVIHALDRGVFVGTICTVLGLQAAPNSNRATLQKKMVGTYELRGIRHPVFLVIAVEDEAFELAVAGIPDGREHPRVILVPTVRRVSHALRQRVESRGACVVGLSDILAMNGDGRLVGLQRSEEVLTTAFQSAAAQAPRSDGVYSQSEIVWRGIEYRCDLTKAHMHFLKLGLVNAEVDIHNVMQAQNGVVWKERYRNVKAIRDKISQFLSRLNSRLLNATPPLGISFSLRRDENAISRADPAAAPADSPLT